MPISNSYRAYHADGPGGSFNTTDPATAFTYWTAPIFDTASKPNPAHDTNPNMVYSPVPPATAATPVTPNTVTPAPWAPYTRAGCDWGAVATANVELENTGIDMPTVFGPNSPEVAQLAADSDPFKDQETADYVGVAVHCAQGSAFCADARAVKFGQTTATPSASPDLLPDEPGGYTGFQGLFGHKYVAPQLGAGTPDVAHNGHQITNAAGNLVDLNGNQINGAFLKNVPGFPGFSSINASQTLAYMADMLESGVPVVNGYISDIHGNEHIRALRRARPRRRRSAAATRATSPRRSTTTPRSARSSPGWRPRGSRRRTRCSCSTSTRVTTRRAPTSGGQSSRRRPTATALPCPGSS